MPVFRYNKKGPGITPGPYQTRNRRIQAMFFANKAAVEYIVAGLGNPGKKYEGTRHNTGFAALDHLAQQWGAQVTKAKFDALVGTASVEGAKVLLLKPQTFMNLSGVAVQKAADFYKVPAQHVIVLFDDISLAPGKLRVRPAGSAGGHNGIKSIISALGQEFPRVKIGVGERPRPEYDLADWVLSRFTAQEWAAVTARFDDVCNAVSMIMKGQLSAAQNKYNG